MKKYFVIAVSLLAASFASAQTAYPGSNWSTVTVNPSPVRGTLEDDNILLQGRYEQGAIVARYGDWKVNTYGAVSYSYDKNGLAYNNKIAPALGVKFQRPMTDNGQLELGLAVVHQNTFRGVTSGPKSGTGASLFAQYWFGWDLAGRK